MLEQQALARDAALSVDANGNRPPEVRLGKISGSGRLRLEFTSPMVSFPSQAEFVEMINE